MTLTPKPQAHAERSTPHYVYHLGYLDNCRVHAISNETSQQHV